MTSVGVAFRRTLLLLSLAAGIGVLIAWRRGQSVSPTPTDPPQWPAWPAQSAQPVQPVQAVQPPTAEHPPGRPRPAVDEQRWVPPNTDGSVPASHPVKVKESSGIFHVPGGRFYDRTRPDRCYPTAASAEADGYRRSKT
jgi:hypothetical protein